MSSQPFDASAEFTRFSDAAAARLKATPSEVSVLPDLGVIATYESVPQILKTTPHWIVWKRETRDGKETKVPYDAKNPKRMAKSNDSATWATFEKASAVANDPLGTFDGIGFMLQGTNFVGVDFDGVIDEAGTVDPYVLKIIAQLGNPYTEITPSGTGMRCFVESEKLPPGKRKFSAGGDEHYGIEIYIGTEGGRYLTISGNKYGGEGVPHIDDLEIPYFLISQFRNTKLKKLWMGDASDFANDQSRADLALCDELVKLLGKDPMKVERYFNASALCDEKWTSRPEYREWTITKALRMKTANSDTKPANASTVMSVYACDVVPHPIEFLWEPYLQTNALNAYYGNPGGGKGFTGMDNIACLTTGRPFPTEATTDRKAMNVVILDAEQGIDDTLVPRLKAAGADLKKVRIITTVRVHEKDDSFSERMITFQEDIAAVKADLQQHPEEKFLFVDPITNYVGDVNFNQDGEVRPVLTMLVQLAEELKITVVIVGHFNKNSNVSTALDKPGGCRAWTAVPRAVWGFFRQSDNKQQRVMVNLKLNNAKEVDTGLLFTVEDQIIGTTPKGKPWVVGHIVWGEHTDATADDLVAADHPESRRDTKGVDFINDALKEGTAPATMVYERAESKHISESTLKRACANVGVLKYKMPEVGWFWQHPTDRTLVPEAARELNQEARVRREQQGASARAIVDGKSDNEEPL